MSFLERLALIGLGLLIFLPGVTARDLWNPDEPRYAEVAREMRQSGECFVPHLNGRIYSEKPPLLFWSIAFASLATGEVDEVAARLPSVFAAVAAMALLFGLARRLFDWRVAWWSTLVFATSGRVLWQGRVGQIDMLLIALVTGAMYCFVRGWLEERPGWFRLFFVMAGLATLAKGPVGLLPPLLALLVFAWSTGNRDLLRRLRLGTGLLIWAAIVLAWLVPAAISGGSEYLETLVVKQNLTRYADPWHHFKPFYYYLTVIPADFFPWSFFLPGALWIGWRRLTGEARRGFLFALAWVAVTLLFFSVSPAKRTVYVLQMYPALAMLVAAPFREIEQSWPRLRGWLLWPTLLLAAFFAALPAAWPLLPRWAPRAAERARVAIAPFEPGLLRDVLLLTLVLGVAACAAYGLGRSGRPGRVVAALAAGMIAVAVYASVVVLPRFQPAKSARPLAEKLLALAAPGEPYAIYPRIDPPFIFYTRRFAELPTSEAELRAYAAREGRVWLFITKEALAGLTEPLPLAEVARDAAREDGYVLLASPPKALPPA